MSDYEIFSVIISIGILIIAVVTLCKNTKKITAHSAL